jgi:hypothetical protein
MPKPLSPLWYTILELGFWMDRNCTNCRFRTNDDDGPTDARPCPLPKLAFAATLHNSPTDPRVYGIAFYGRPALLRGERPHAPYTCGSRRDTRGRPKSS